MVITKREARIRRHLRVRKRLRGTADCPRLSVFRSLNHIYAQIIDDISGKTLISASTLEADIKSDLKGKTKVEKAGLVGKLVAERARDKGIEQIVFDRNGFKYHGRIKALADSARESGLRF